MKKECNHYFSRDKVVDGIYGWVEGYGVPPKPHNDVIMITEDKLKLGETIEGKIIGAIIRNDGDHKLICIKPNRKEDDIAELSDNEMNMLLKLYTLKYRGDAWVGRNIAILLLGDYDRSKKWGYDEKRLFDDHSSNLTTVYHFNLEDTL